jgi:hypothetical protein
MNDHELDDQMRRLAESYNEPPATPREEMWARIEQGRAAGSVVAIGAVRRRYWLRTVAGIAAVLVVGVGLGRLSHRIVPTGSSSAGSPVASSSRGDTVAVRPVAVVALADRPAQDSGELSGSPAVAGASADAANRVRATRAARLATLSAARRDDSRALASFGEPRGAQGVVGEGTAASAYQLAVVEHMARAEVLLTSFLAESRTSGTSARTATQFAALSRDLLKTTRLLLATRAADDPALTRLLEDLELVLMQISQYSSEGRRGDLDAINQSLDRRNVLPKLRSAVPAGASATTGL